MKSPGTPEGTCGESQNVKSHGGGTDYSAPCKQPVGPKGTHRGDHIDQNGNRWPQ